MSDSRRVQRGADSGQPVQSSALHAKTAVIDAASGSQPASPPSDLIELGRVVSAYGIKGWVKVQPHSAQAEVLLAAPTWWLAPPTPSGKARALTVKTSRPQGSTVVAALQGVDDRDQADALRSLRVHVSRSDFPAPENGEYYWIDLIGCLVFGQDDDRAGILLGRVSDVTDNGAHALLKVQRLHEVEGETEPQPVLTDKGHEQEILVPFVDAHLLSVDLAARRIETNWPLDYD